MNRIKLLLKQCARLRLRWREARTAHRRTNAQLVETSIALDRANSRIAEVEKCFKVTLNYQGERRSHRCSIELSDYALEVANLESEEIFLHVARQLIDYYRKERIR